MPLSVATFIRCRTHNQPVWTRLYLNAQWTRKLIRNVPWLHAQFLLARAVLNSRLVSRQTWQQVFAPLQSLPCDVCKIHGVKYIHWCVVVKWSHRTVLIHLPNCSQLWCIPLGHHDLQCFAIGHEYHLIYTLSWNLITVDTLGVFSLAPANSWPQKLLIYSFKMVFFYFFIYIYVHI